MKMKMKMKMKKSLFSLGLQEALMNVGEFTAGSEKPLMRRYRQETQRVSKGRQHLQVLRKTYAEKLKFLYAMNLKTKSLEVRQKVPRTPSKIDTEYNPDDVPQYFQVSVNILEGRKLSWANTKSATSYVIVVLDKKKHRTSVRRNMEEPYYRESFVFELYASVHEVQRQSLYLAVLEPRCCAPPRLLGEANIDLAAVWVQPHHTVSHKWAQLTLPKDDGVGPVGFLKVDISILFRGEMQVMSAITYEDKMEDNLLLPSGSEQQRASYQVTVYAAYSLPSGTHCHADRFGKPPSTFVRVSFCGLVAKTGIQCRTYNPMYAEQISMVEMFPNICQMIKLEVCSADGCANRVLASTHLKLTQISHGGENGFLPTFGPSLLHMYGPWSSAAVVTGEDGPYHRGVMLVALKTVVPYYKHSIRTINVEPVAPLRQGSQWALEDFCVYCSIFEVSMIDRRVSGKNCGVAITVGEMPCNNRADEDFVSLMHAIKEGKLHYTGTMDVLKSRPVYGYLEFPNEYPVLQLATRLPDFRFRMYRNNMIHEIVTDLELDLTNAESRLLSHDYSYPNDLIEQLNRSFDDAAAKILKFLDIVLYSSVSDERQHSTELDVKQMQLQKEEIEKIYQRISKKAKSSSAQSIFPASKSFCETEGGTKKAVKLLLAEGKTVVQDLKQLIFKTCEGWPDVVLWLLTNGSRVAYAKIAATDIIHSVIPEQRGRDCGEIKTVYLKPLKCLKHLNAESNCWCISAKIELLWWMGTYRQRGSFDSCLPAGHKLKNKEYAMFIKCSPLVVECRVNIYRAKLNFGNDATYVVSPFVRVNFMNTVKETQVQQKSVNPVWNEVIRISRNAYSSPERLTEYPPEVLVEVYDWDATDKKELLGRLQVEPVVDDRQDFAPQLEWQDLLKGGEPSGRILISAQLMQMPEKLLKTTYYCPTQESFYAPGVKDQGDVLSEQPEPLPSSLVPTPCTYKVDVYWWGLRNVNIIHKPCVVLEMEDVTIKSGIITDAKANCNFPNGKTSQVFEANLGDANCSPLSVRLYDSGTFGRTLFLGLNVVRKPHKYMVGWIPKNEREESLYSSSITSAAFVQVNRMVFIKRSLRSTEESEDAVSYVSNIKSVKPMKAKVSLWRKLLCCKEVDEEEYTLLPVFAKEKEQLKVVKKNLLVEEKNWWMRYSAAQTDYVDDDKNVGNRFVIYDSELECQPEFSRFKDWCSTLKIYNGKKTGIPEKDEQLHCGYLKVGIAIYKWPPPGNTVAVSPCGVELDRGYFDDHPDNEPSKFLVRVYVVKAIGLAKDPNEKSCPYVTVQCGRRILGERSSHASKTVNPVIGKVYEFRCSLPEDYLLKVSLLNCDSSPPDDLIGTTCIDLEDRVYTKHRACVGLATEYNLSGLSKWRDHQKPSAILEDLCLKNHLPPPVFPDASSVMVNGVEYKDCDNGRKYGSTAERKENICLNLLHKWHTLPICGYRLVPEHVETRTLYHPEKPEVEQGKIQLWVDMFPLDSGLFIPAPVEITPRHIEEFELRVIVWDVKDVKLREDGASDIYVKAWIGPSDEAQDTDIHFKSLHGEGNFNWRMIFHFQYQHSERKLVLQEKGPFTEVEEHVPPILIVQVQDSAAPTPEEFLGTLMLDLTSMPRGAKVARHCTPAVLERRRINLFIVRSIRAWWPLKRLDRTTGNYHAAGMIDLELTLLPKEKAVLMPVGVGRAAPTPLPKPQRSKRQSKNTDGFKMKVFTKCKTIGECFKQQKRAVISFVLSILLVLVVITTCAYWDLQGMMFDTLVEPTKWDESYVLKNRYSSLS